MNIAPASQMLIFIIQGAQRQRNRCSTPPVSLLNSAGRGARFGAEYSSFFYNMLRQFVRQLIEVNSSNRRGGVGAFLSAFDIMLQGHSGGCMSCRRLRLRYVFGCVVYVR